MYNKNINYEWDEAKRASNIVKHGVDFTLIESFDWANSLIAPDVRFEDKRYDAFGVIDDRLYYVVYTIRKTNIRLISFRKANRKEIQRYEQIILSD